MGCRHRAGVCQFHVDSGSHDRQRVAAQYRRRACRDQQPGHVDCHILCGRRGHCRAAHRVAGCALWHRAGVHHGHGDVRPALGAVRHGADARDDHRRAHLAGHGRWPPDAAVADVAAAYLSQGKGGRGHHAMVHDHADRAHPGPAARRVAVRHAFLAVDLLHQPSAFHGVPGLRRQAAQPIRDAPHAYADRRGRPGPAHPVGGCAATHARSRQGARLVFIK